MKIGKAALGTILLGASLARMAAADTLAPATGERASVLPWVLGGLGLIAVAALLVLTALDAKRKKNTPPEPPAAPPEGPESGEPGVPPEDGGDTINHTS